MPVTAVIGLQWGDEGKGKMVDLLASRVDVVVRCQGGSNAGHTVWVGGEKTVLHLVPSGILNGTMPCVVGHGVVVDPEQLLAEIDALESRGVRCRGRLFVSDRAHVVAPLHREIDRMQEEARGVGKIGTTGRGIGPTYADKSARIGIRMMDIVDRDRCEAAVRRLYAERRSNFAARSDGEHEDAAAQAAAALAAHGERLKPYVTDTVHLLMESARQDLDIFLEGAQGALLDLDLGTYPYVTSSNTTIGGLLAGSGLAPQHVRRVLGIAKAYSTRVGSGPYPTELKDATGDELRRRGAEFGATTGRPRRCGWFDGVAARFAAETNGVTELVLTKMDVLSGFEELKICTAYKVRGRAVEAYPSDTEVLAVAEPVYRSFPGWQGDISTLRDEADLPPAARDYIKALEDVVGIPATFVSTGPGREAIIERPTAGARG